MSSASITTPGMQALPLTWKIVKELCEKEGVCLSMYLPGHKAGSGTMPATARLKTWLAELEPNLIARGMAVSDAADLLQPLKDLLKVEDMAKGYGGGLALFRTSGYFQVIETPPLEDGFYAVEGRFTVRPLLEFLNPRTHFQLLTLTRKNVRLLEVDWNSVSEVELPPNVPRNLELFMNLESPELMQNRTSSGSTAAQMGGVAFGTGSTKEKHYHYVHDFHRAIDLALQENLQRTQLPLMLAGVETEVASYRAVNTYKNLVDESVIASPDGGFTDDELGRRARQLMSNYVSDEERHAMALFHAHDGTAKASSLEEFILRLADKGRVLHLFVNGTERHMGDVFHVLGKGAWSGGFVCREEDLVNASVVETIRHGGNVWTVPPQEAPKNTALAAVFRY